MAKKSEELIEKPVATRGRPRKDASTSSASKKASKTKKKTSKKARSSKKAVNKTSKTRTKKAATSDVVENVEIVENNENLIETAKLENIELNKNNSVDSVEVQEVSIEVEEPIEQSNNPVLEETQTVSPIISEPEKKSTKRTIRNISIKKVNTVASKPKTEIENDSTTDNVELQVVPVQDIETEEIDESVVQEKISPAIVEAPKVSQKVKRTLRLNIKPHKELKDDLATSPSYKKDESINQNSSFFNEPSIFAKFNIDIISTENEEEQNDVSLNESSDKEINEEVVSENVEETTTDKCEVDESTIINSVLTILESNPEQTEEPEMIQESENTTSKAVEEIIESTQETNVEEPIPEELEDSILEDCMDELLLEELDINNTDLGEEILETAQEEKVELKEVAETVEQEIPVQKADNTPIGKFFDSSIPSMTSSVNNTFSKIKKSIFSNISPIFKKFTFEEASLRTHETENLEENIVQPENTLSDIQKALENFTPNAQNITNITEMDVQSKPVMTIPVIETDTSISPIPSDNNYNVQEQLNIITPLADSSYDNLEDIDEEYEFSSKLSDKLKEETENNSENNEIDYDNISPEDLEKIKPEEYNDETFSIESYFGIDEDNNEENENFNKPESKESTSSIPENDFAQKFIKTNELVSSTSAEVEIKSNESEEDFVDTNNSKELSQKDLELEKTIQEKDLEISNLSKLLESFTETISTLTNRIADLENKQSSEKETSAVVDIISEKVENTNSEETESDEINIDDINIEDLDINDIDIDIDIDLDAVELLENSNLESEESSLLSEEENKSVESILSEAFLSKDFELDSNLKDELLSEVLSYEENLSENETDFDEALLEEALLEDLSDEELENLDNTEEQFSVEPTSDFSKIIDSLTKAITELEQAPDIKNEVEKKNVAIPLAPLPAELTNYTVTEEKAINILINKDDIFSISILNETYEIVADFDGISVLSENLHISTPKNNFFVKIGNKYIEIHNKKDHFELNTNFEDIEFANAINNIAFAKKNNKIELNIKEAFKLSSVNNKIELSMLNKAIADLTSAQTASNEKQDDSSICDNKTLLISEETQKVYLPYTIEDVMKKLKSSEEYQTVQEVVDKEYTLPLSTFKMPIISRFKEAYRFMRTKENSSVYAAVDLALELMFNSNLNPAVIRAAKDLKELNIYLDCLYENEVEKFDCFKIVYKVLPKIK